jgi:hypothetical protein
MIRIFKGVNNSNKLEGVLNPVKGLKNDRNKILQEKHCPIQILKQHQALKMFDRWEVSNDEHIY